MRCSPSIENGPYQGPVPSKSIFSEITQHIKLKFWKVSFGRLSNISSNSEMVKLDKFVKLTHLVREIQTATFLWSEI